MKAFLTTKSRLTEGTRASQPTVVRRVASTPVRIEIGTGAIAPKVAIVRRKAAAPVKVEVGTGAIAPKVAIARGTQSPSR